MCRIRNYILDQEFENGADVVAMVDDDMRGIFYWEHNKRKKLKTDEIVPFIEKYSIVCKELGGYFWGINLNDDRQTYKEYTPFSTVSFIGGPFQCFLKDEVRIRYDERFPLKEDYDMTLQQTNRHRVALRVNKYYYEVKQSEQVGGCANYRNLEKEKEQVELLQKKWGSQIVKFDNCDRNHQTSKVRTGRKIDYNPVIKIPIKGV